MDAGDAPRLGPRFVAAVDDAVDLHDGQLRTGTAVPYVGHLLGVASLVLEDGGDEEQAIAAMLHDAAEDQGGSRVLAEIERRFGARVTGFVEALSDSITEAGEPKEDWRLRKERYLAHLRAVGDEATPRVSLADKLDNARATLRDLITHGDAVWGRFKAGRDKQLWYYRELVAIFRAAPIASPMVRELAAVVDEIESISRRSGGRSSE